MYYFCTNISIIPTALMVGSGMVLTLPSESHPVCVSLSQRRSSINVPLTLTPSDSGRRLEKLSSQDPKVSVSVISLLLCLFVVFWQEITMHEQCTCPSQPMQDSFMTFVPPKSINDLSIPHRIISSATIKRC